MLGHGSKNKTGRKPAIFFGDNVNDFLVSKTSGFDFIFVSQWTDKGDWKEYTQQNKITTIHELKDAWVWEQTFSW